MKMLPRDHFVPGSSIMLQNKPPQTPIFERHHALVAQSRCRAQRRRPARRRPAWRGRVDAARWTPTITHMACAERVACVVRAAASTLEQACAARVPCAERVPCAVRATVAPAARCRSICCVWPYWVPLVDAVLNVVVWAAARRRGRVVWDHAGRSSTLQTPGRPG